MASSVPQNAAGASKSHMKDKFLKNPFHGLGDKLKNTSLHDVKVGIIHKKHEVGKFANLFNANHRHDEEHEKITDEKRSRIAESHRFESFAPERDNNEIKWYVDGRDYYWAVSTALERAKETIYIADWWLSPELFMRRPAYYNQEWRLDQILKRRAEAGVKIYVIVYREVEAALTCNSAHTKNALRALCPEGQPGHGNITVMRHPDHNVLENAADMTFYWAHHEKFIVIDYDVAFIGGLDLCFGRWDSHDHQLADVHPAGVAGEIWPGQDFNNNRIMDFQSVDDWKTNELSKAEYGRMPWHDVAMGVIGDCVIDIAEHFVLRHNFVKRDKYKRDDRKDWLMMPGREENADEDLVGVQRPNHPMGEYIMHPLSPMQNKRIGNQGTVHAQIVRSSADWSSGILTEHSIQNAYQQLIREAQHYVYIENQFFITATGDQQAPIKNTIGSAIVDAIVRAAQENRKFRIIILIPAIPGFAGDLREDAAMGTRAIMDYQYKSINRGDHSIYGRVKAAGYDPTKYIFFFNLRSFDRLNVTPELKEQERKAGVTYNEVQRAEAQEIMSEGIQGVKDGEGHADSHMGTHQVPGLHRDDAGDETAEERTDAKRRWEATEGGPADPTSADSVAKLAMHNTKSLMDEPWDGSEQEEVDLWIQEELYIHGKTMIIDDRHVICGSSNLNDRSQLGIHDSELAIVMTDTKMIDSKMDGQPYKAGYHAATLRRYLWREHLGLLPPQELDASKDINAQPPGDSPNNIAEDETYGFVEDPLSEDVWNMWTGRATKNTEIFRQLFHADPDDNIKTFQDYARFLPAKEIKSGHIYDRMTPAREIRAKLDQIKGHLVWFPLEFLRDAAMAERGLQVNAYTESIYT